MTLVCQSHPPGHGQMDPEYPDVFSVLQIREIHFSRSLFEQFLLKLAWVDSAAAINNSVRQMGLLRPWPRSDQAW